MLKKPRLTGTHLLSLLPWLILALGRSIAAVLWQDACQDAVRVSEAALYQARAQGRNRIIDYEKSRS